MLSIATAAAYADLVREGKIVPEPRKNGAKTEPATVGTVGLKQKIAQAKPQTTSKPSVQASVKTDPFAGLNFSREERSTVEKFCKNSNITLSDWRKRHDAQKKEFGNAFGRE